MTARFVALTLALCPAALAGVRVADSASGQLTFQATQAGARFTGGFGRFEVRLDFDPAEPAAGRLDVVVATASVDTRDRERDDVLRSSEFFGSEQYPQAAYRAAGFQRDGDAWRATGTLTIRGITRPVPVRFTLEPAEGASLMKGEATLRRLAFGLGQREFATTEWVGDEVEVRFELRLRPAPP